MKSQGKRKIPPGMCYLCQKSPATVSDGIGSMVCQTCLDRIQEALLKDAVPPGYKRKK